MAGWWFGTFFIFPYIGNNDPQWLIFFKMVRTTNQMAIYGKIHRNIPAGGFTESSIFQLAAMTFDDWRVNMNLQTSQRATLSKSSERTERLIRSQSQQLLPSGYLTVCHGSHDPFIDGLPSYKMGGFSMAMLVYQRVIIIFPCQNFGAVYHFWTAKYHGAEMMWTLPWRIVHPRNSSIYTSLPVYPPNLGVS